MKPIKNSLRSLRRKKGLSLEEAANQIGLSRTWLRMMETGEPAYIDTIKKLLAFYGATFEEAFGSACVPAAPEPQEKNDPNDRFEQLTIAIDDPASEKASEEAPHKLDLAKLLAARDDALIEKMEQRFRKMLERSTYGIVSTPSAPRPETDDALLRESSGATSDIDGTTDTDGATTIPYASVSNSYVMRQTWIDTLVRGRIYELTCYPVTELVKDPDMVQKGKLETVDYRKVRDPDQVRFVNGIPRSVYDKYVRGVKAEYMGTGYFITQDSPAYCIEKEFVCTCKIAYEKENE